MKAMKVLGIVLVALGSFWILGSRAQTRIDPGVSEAMRAKLTYAQHVLEGITTDNYSLVVANAEKLRRLSNVAGWQARQTPEYELFTNEYRRHADALMVAGKEKNLDAATVAYVQMTLSCIGCHKYIRGVQGVRLERSGR